MAGLFVTSCVCDETLRDNHVHGLEEIAHQKVQIPVMTTLRAAKIQ
jgi:hypothetical protein